MSHEDLEQRVRALLAEGRKIEAVKLYKDETGSSLLEAKNQVEAWEAAVESLPAHELTTGDGEAEILRLLGEGRKIEAIQLYRQNLGVGLKEAKQAVEALAERQGVVVRRGCLGLVLLALAGVAACVSVCCMLSLATMSTACGWTAIGPDR